ncbi:MAG: phage antirepressor KilAC domain-containing protein [Bacteroidetes bacterium]|jgi:Phage antirepressor protein KilAC domain.|uniref:phage antirepressor KilAC domain-containing protein n=1 Tax=Phnomibacter sp. TaxID=2836217 RepID=UPI003FA701AD|nr:phage antirepressor KilAC domain-containing protein [Bacteroidota bacterium]
MNSIKVYRDATGAPLFDLNQTGKLLFGIGHHHFMRILRNQGWLLKNNTPSQPMLNKGYMVHKLKGITCNNIRLSVPVTLVRIEGLNYLRRAILKRHRQALANNKSI